MSVGAAGFVSGVGEVGMVGGIPLFKSIDLSPVPEPSWWVALSGTDGTCAAVPADFDTGVFNFSSSLEIFCCFSNLNPGWRSVIQSLVHFFSSLMSFYSLSRASELCAWQVQPLVQSALFPVPEILLGVALLLAHFSFLVGDYVFATWSAITVADYQIKCSNFRLT